MKFKKLVIHKTSWRSNESSGAPVIFAGEVTECGHKWVVGSMVWKHVTCKRCLKSKRAGRDSK